MLRIPCPERSNWKGLADEYGFHFHTMYGQPYWDESAYYRFTLEQIERDLEEPTAELQQMCLAVVDKVLADEELLRRFQIPEAFWSWLANSWQQRQPSLYSRLDLAYNGSGPAKLYENNADTPTSVYETGFWQWLWLEQQVNSGTLHPQADQFNSLQEKLVGRFAELGRGHSQAPLLHFGCCRDSEEDRGTVQYLQDCAEEAGVWSDFVYIEDIGEGRQETDLGAVLPCYTDQHDRIIEWMFKLYPWEFMHREDFAPLLLQADVQWLEPPWKAILSNKALLPLLWQMFPNHPNLLPAYFEDEAQHLDGCDYVKKPIYSREGANIEMRKQGQRVAAVDGPYGEEGYIVQALYPLPVFGDNHTLIGSWLVGDEPAGISVREDKSPITQDLSRYLPHVILG